MAGLRRLRFRHGGLSGGPSTDSPSAALPFQASPTAPLPRASRSACSRDTAARRAPRHAPITRANVFGRHAHLPPAPPSGRSVSSEITGVAALRRGFRGLPIGRRWGADGMRNSLVVLAGTHRSQLPVPDAEIQLVTQGTGGSSLPGVGDGPVRSCPSSRPRRRPDRTGPAANNRGRAQAGEDPMSRRRFGGTAPPTWATPPTPRDESW